MRQFDKREAHILSNYYTYIWYESRGGVYVKIKEKGRYMKSIIDFKIYNSGLK